MVAEPEAKPASLTAWISAHCHLPAAGEKQVCSEQVTLRAQGEAVQGLPSVVLPLTVSGLPVYLWWRAGHFAPPAYFDQIFRITNHLIVDSARFSGSGTDLQGVAAWLQKSLGAVAVTDLNWTRITPWRELLAQCFDAPERRPFLDRLSEVRIEYEQESVRLPTQRAQSLLLTGWLASRLGWEFVGQRAQEEGTPRSFLFTSGKRAIRVERLLRRIEGDGSGVCFAIELEANGAAPARFSLARGVDGKVVQTCAEVAGQPPLGRTVRLEVLDEVEILNEELKLARRDRIYEEALQMAARMTATSG
jgi:glucose-6-phosphate dehydrogenase assembly protein OpcA